jgi:triacylglycerol lipase
MSGSTHPRRAAAMILAVSIVAVAGCAAPVGPSPVPKDPVVIVAGTYASGPIADIAYAPLKGRLTNDGYPTFVYDLPDLGLGDIAVTSAGLREFVEQVRRITGSGRVDLIGHSQGALVSRYYVKYLGGDAVVDSLVSLAAPHYGTIEANIAAFLLGFGTCFGSLACQQMSIGSPFLNALNDGDDTIGDVKYTNFATVLDQIVIPYTSGHLSNDGNNTNVTVQGQCPLRVVAHITMATDGAVYSGIRDALRHEPITLDCFAV